MHLNSNDMETLSKIRVEEEKQVDPSKIMQIGMGFWASKTLLTAVKLELFTHLATQSLNGNEIKHRLGLHSRGLYDFLNSNFFRLTR